MKIKELHIEKLYEKYDFDWSFDDKVNILAGINGSFKSTLLNIIKKMCEIDNPDYDLSHVKAAYTDGYQLDYYCTSLDSHFDTPQKKIDFINKLKETNPEITLPVQEGQYERLKITMSHFDEQKDGVKITEEDFKKEVILYYISTFDIKHETKQDESQLDAILNNLQSEYGFYLSDLAKKVSEFVATHNTLTKEDLDKINHKKDVFISIVNESFKETNKVIDPNESKIVFIHQEDQTRIPASKLSSGEKQLLIIFLTVLLQNQSECIVVMDEPEISLHIHWQYALIDNLIRLNPNAQFIISTHSPSIFGKGWGTKVVYTHKLVSTEHGRD